MKRNIFLTIAIILSCYSFAHADSAAFTVSCTIPSIPGMNAPLLAGDNEQIQRPATETSVTVVPSTQENQQPVQAEKQKAMEEEMTKKEKPSEIIQEEYRKEKSLNEIERYTTIVKTFYSR